MNIDKLLSLKQELKEKCVYDIVDLCKKYDKDYTLEELVQYRKIDILELIDGINKAKSDNNKIPVNKKNKFAAIISQFAKLEKKVAPQNDDNLIDDNNTSKRVLVYIFIYFYVFIYHQIY